MEKPRKTKNGSTHRHRKLDDIKEAYNKTKRNQNKIYKAMSNEKQKVRRNKKNRDTQDFQISKQSRIKLKKIKTYTITKQETK